MLQKEKGIIPGNSGIMPVNFDGLFVYFFN